MSAEESVIGGLAGRYAVAMFELAQEMGEADQNKLADDLAALKILIDATQDLQKLLKSPVINAEEQAAALDAVLAKAGAHQLVRNFAALVVAKRRAFALADMAAQYGALVAGARNEIVARVTSARDLSAGQIDALKAELEKAAGQNVIVKNETDAALLGGMVVKLGSQMIDGSLRTKLNSLKTALNQG
ncbi:F0F1 ATP synthase subunit delta [Alphaproteobacteria bacterium]|nr:F0F1 ATP synthase subunit delta [Alphaproteobacteria bacterium]MDB2523345.1 F0F1 ATP synthase subunit delta [Alphaproteobacteria bacterium]